MGMSPPIRRECGRFAVRCRNLFDHRGEPFDAKGLGETGGGAMCRTNRRHVGLFQSGEDDDRRSLTRAVECFQHCHAMDAGIDIDNDHVHLIQTIV